jgi:hypothetical protein
VSPAAAACRAGLVVTLVLRRDHRHNALPPPQPPTPADHHGGACGGGGRQAHAPAPRSSRCAAAGAPLGGGPAALCHGGRRHHSAGCALGAGVEGGAQRDGAARRHGCQQPHCAAAGCQCDGQQRSRCAVAPTPVLHHTGDCDRAGRRCVRPRGVRAAVPDCQRGQRQQYLPCRCARCGVAPGLAPGQQRVCAEPARLRHAHGRQPDGGSTGAVAGPQPARAARACGWPAGAVGHHVGARGVLVRGAGGRDLRPAGVRGAGPAAAPHSQPRRRRRQRGPQHPRGPAGATRALAVRATHAPRGHASCGPATHPCGTSPRHSGGGRLGQRPDQHRGISPR